MIENIRDKKVIELYQVLTRSDLKGYYEDAFSIEMLMSILCVDVLARGELKQSEIILLAKEIIRLSENDGGFDKYSTYNWARAALEYMHKGATINDIHKKNTYDLKKEVSEYLER